MPVATSVREGVEVARRTLLAPTALVLTVALFGIVVLLQRDLLPDEMTAIVTPAFGVALLTDAILYNDFGLRGVRPPLWLLLGLSLYIEAVVFVAFARFVRRRYLQ